MSDRNTTLEIGDRVALDCPNGDPAKPPRLGTVVDVPGFPGVLRSFSVAWDDCKSVDRGWFRSALRKIPKSVHSPAAPASRPPAQGESRD